MIQVEVSNRLPQNSDLILTQSQILHLFYEFKQANTQEQVKTLEQKMRRMIVNVKNFATIISLILAKDVSFDDKVLMISIMNFVVEELLKKYENIRNKMKSRVAHKHVDELRRDIVNISNKMEKIIDCNTVPVHLKTKVVFLLLKLFNRSKEDWQSARVSSKMQFYFRKDNIVIAIAYITNILKLGFSIRQKLEIIRKAIVYLPNSGAKCFAKIVRENTLNQSLNHDMSSILQQMLNLLKTQQSEVRREIVINWSNSEIFLTLIKAIIEQPNNQNNNYHYLTQCRLNLEQWRDKLLEIIKKMSNLVCFHNVIKQCYNFVVFFIQYIRYFWQTSYVRCQDTQPQMFEDSFGKYLVLFINATNMTVLPVCFVCSLGNYQVSNTVHSDGSSLTMEDKIYLFQNYIYKIYQYYQYKIQELLQTTSKQTQTQTIQLFEQLCSAEQVDSQSQNFPYSYSIWLLSLVEHYKHIGYYVKNLIQCLLFCGSRDMSNLEWLQQEVVIVNQFNPKRNQNVDMGVLLSLILYKNIVLDRNYLQECVGKYILSVVNSEQRDCIFNKSPQSICMFLILLQNYMQEIQIYTSVNMRIKQYKLSQFMKLLITHLAHTNNMGNLPLMYLSTIKKYIKLLKCLIRQYKQSPTYISYCKTIQFVQLEQPLQQFHQLLKTVPIHYYTELYEEIIDYQLFKIQGESDAQTISRVKVVIDNAVTYYQNTNNFMEYGHKIFKMFEQVCNCPEYVELMGSIFLEVHKFVTNSKQALIQFEQDAVNMCVMVLKKPHIIAAIEQQTLKTLWQIVYAVLDIYQWKEYTTKAQINFANKSIDDQFYVPESSFTHKQLQLFYLTSNYIIPPELTTLVFKKAKQTVLNITSTLTYKKRNLLIAKYRPYQLQQITFLLCLHKIIINYCDHLTPEIIEEFLQVYWSSYEFRLEFPDDFNYVNGKYNLIVVLLLRYAWKGLWAVLSKKDEAIVDKIYFEIFYNEVSYRVEYDAPLLVMNALHALQRLWSTNYEIDKYLLKYAHFLVGGCILCLDRIYENYRCNKDDQVQIQAFKYQIKDPVLQTQLKITSFIKKLTAGQPYVDEFEQMRSFYHKIRENQKTYQWFMKSMALYVKMQVYLDQFHSILGVMKMRKKNGMTIYRLYKKVRTQFYDQLV